MSNTRRACLSILLTTVLIATPSAVMLTPSVPGESVSAHPLVASQGPSTQATDPGLLQIELFGRPGVAPADPVPNTFVVNSVIETFEVDMINPSSGLPIEEGATVSLENVTVSGTTNPLANVTVAARSGSYSTMANSTGSFRFVRVALLEGLNVLTVTTTSGNMTETALLIVTSDTFCKLMVNPIQAATKLARLQVTGQTEYGAVVTVNGVPAQVSSNGVWSLNVTLVEGSNLLDVNATDPVGNGVSTVLSTTLDTTPPTLEVLSPSAGSQASQPVVTISGTAEPDSIVTVNGVVASNGTALWSARIGLVNGTNLITVTAADALGNTAYSNFTLAYVPIQSVSPDEMGKAIDDLNNALRQAIKDADEFASLVMFISLILFLVSVFFTGALWYVLSNRLKSLAAQGESEQSLEEIEEESPKDVEQEFEDLEKEIRRDENA